MQDRDSQRELANRAVSLVESIRYETSYRMELHELDDAIFWILEDNVLDCEMIREEADLVYGAFARIFLRHEPM